MFQVLIGRLVTDSSGNVLQDSSGFQVLIGRLVTSNIEGNEYINIKFQVLIGRLVTIRLLETFLFLPKLRFKSL